MPRTKRLILAVLAAAAALLAAKPASACTISATGVAFGAYNPQGGSNKDGTGTIALACAPSVSAPIVALGAGSSGSILARTMHNGATALNYNLFTDVPRSILWGDGTVGVTVTLSGGVVSSGQRNFSRTIYGRIPASQNVRAGAYNDTLVVTVTF